MFIILLSAFEVGAGTFSPNGDGVHTLVRLVEKGTYQLLKNILKRLHEHHFFTSLLIHIKHV
jgi:hypothetical protein